jgi:protein-S-isoprenylcysteine O-methyltransferase Ste14
MEHALISEHARMVKHTADKAHGTVMGVTVVLIFPLGVLSRVMLHRVMSPRALLHFHIGCQMLGLALLLAGFGLGVWTAILHKEVLWRAPPPPSSTSS